MKEEVKVKIVVCDDEEGLKKEETIFLKENIYILKEISLSNLNILKKYILGLMMFNIELC